MGAARFWRLSGRNKLLLVEAFLAVAAASLGIRFLSFKTVAGYSGIGTTSPRPAHPRAVISECRWAVRRVGGLVPWKVVCFQQGLALQWMLRRRGLPSMLHYGVAQTSEKGLAAHVWISLDREVLIGGEEAPGFACLATFPAEEAGVAGTMR